MDEQLKKIKEKYMSYEYDYNLNKNDVEHLIRQAEKVQDLQEYRNESSKFHVDLNEFLQQRSKKMPINKVWGLHFCDVAMQYIQQLEKFAEMLIGEEELHERGEFGTEMNRLFQQNKRYKDALEFYADEENYKGFHDIIRDRNVWMILEDGGEKARQTMRGESE